jgi:NADH-quinone oxidoreductase subunit L
MVNLDIVAILVPLLPLAGSLLLAALRRRIPATLAGGIATALLATAFVFSLILFQVFDPATGGHTVVLFDWIRASGIDVPFALRIDALSITMMLIITGIGSLIHLYSIGYMHGDERAPTFFAQLQLFSFAMLLLVMGSNLLITFIGWEGVGLCSYLLIGFWHKVPAYNYAARKAFVMNRIGDVAMVLAMALLISSFGTLEYVTILEQAGGQDVNSTVMTFLTLLLFLGATGKSAQVPLFTWLPDAMAGPTPVSALIHAATMVTAGIFLVVRFSGLFELAAFTRDIILLTGTITAMMAASIGLFQNDIKKVLAYSTVSQLGYMFVALGMGAYSVAMFHVTTHAFFKALLFLGAGSVIHSLGGEQDIRRMGGLRGRIKITYWTFLMGTLAISGFPLMSGFFSKDLILAHAFQRSPWLFLVLLIGALLTTYYMFRLLFLVFFGTYRGTGHPHESPAIMTVPLMILAVLSVIGGALYLPHLFGGHEAMKHYLASAAEGIGMEALRLPASTEWTLMGITTGMVVATILLAHAHFVRRTSTVARAGRLPAYQRIPAEGWYVDELYAYLFEKPYSWMGHKLFTVGEQRMLAPLVNGIGGVALRVGILVRRIQTGNASFHLLAMVAGIIGFLIIIILNN